MMKQQTSNEAATFSLPKGMDHDLDTQTACALARSLTEFCAATTQISCAGLAVVYFRLSMDWSCAGPDTLALQKGCCRKICELALAATDATENSHEKYQEWKDVLDQWQCGENGASMEPDISLARAALEKLGSRGKKRCASVLTPAQTATKQSSSVGSLLKYSLVTPVNKQSKQTPKTDCSGVAPAVRIPSTQRFSLNRPLQRNLNAEQNENTTKESFSSSSLVDITSSGSTATHTMARLVSSDDSVANGSSNSVEKNMIDDFANDDNNNNNNNVASTATSSKPVEDRNAASGSAARQLVLTEESIPITRGASPAMVQFIVSDAIASARTKIAVSERGGVAGKTLLRTRGRKADEGSDDESMESINKRVRSGSFESSEIKRTPCGFCFNCTKTECGFCQACKCSVSSLGSCLQKVTSHRFACMCSVHGIILLLLLFFIADVPRISSSSLRTGTCCWLEVHL